MKNTKIESVFAFDQPNRLDKYLASEVGDLSRGEIQMLIQNGFCLVNGKTCLKSSYQMRQGDFVSLVLPQAPSLDLHPEVIDLDVIYQDSNTIVINKPAGLVVHPGAGRASGTLVNAILHYWPELREVGETGRPGIVHRLDKDTSGVLVTARTQPSYLWLVKQFKSRKTIKTYMALVDGAPPTPSGRIEGSIGRDSRFRQKMAFLPEGMGRKAVSEYRTIASFDKHTLLEVHPITGRTHQIRVQLAYIGCPVVGDKVYGYRKVTIPTSRFLLHAARLEITLLDENQPRNFEAELPADFTEALTELHT